MICIWRSNNCWFLQLESSENWSVSHTNHGFSLQFWLDFGLDLDGWVACSNQRWLEIPNPSKPHKLNSTGFQGLKQVHLALVCSIAGQRCLPPCVIAKFHVQPLPPNERTRGKRLKTLPSLSREQLVRLKKTGLDGWWFQPITRDQTKISHWRSLKSSLWIIIFKYGPTKTCPELGCFPTKVESCDNSSVELRSTLRHHHKIVTLSPLLDVPSGKLT